jgi:hypothetical protein
VHNVNQANQALKQQISPPQIKQQEAITSSQIFPLLTIQPCTTCSSQFYIPFPQKLEDIKTTRSSDRQAGRAQGGSTRRLCSIHAASPGSLLTRPYWIEFASRHCGVGGPIMLEQLLPVPASGRAEEGGRGCHRAVVRRRSSQGVGFVHRRCCVNGGAEGGAVSPDALREEVPPLVMEEASGVGWGAGCGWWAQSGYGGWVHAGCVRKTLCFWQKRSPNCDFYSRSTFLVITQPDGWVRREG